MGKRIFNFVMDWTKTILLGALLAILVNAFIIQAYRVQGQSMVPTLHSDDYTVIFKIGNNYDYGDIVVIDSRVKRHRTIKDALVENNLLAPIFVKDDEHLWIKRVIGKPNDRLEIKDDQLYRNGQLVDEPYINEKMMNNPDKVIVVPKDYIYVMGDNRNYSMDSRVIGPIPLDNVLGKVIFSE